MDEFDLIERYFAVAKPRADVIEGIGDDAAVTRLDSGYDLVIATDSLIEGTHFLPGMPADALGYRSLAVNLSDLAAMSAEPLWCTLALSMPDGSANWVEHFAAGFLAAADEFSIGLVGGDTVHWLAFGFGSGLLPRAPGTWGSLITVLGYWLVCRLFGVP